MAIGVDTKVVLSEKIDDVTIDDQFDLFVGQALLRCPIDKID